MTVFPDVDESLIDEELSERWEKIQEIRGEITKVLERARKEKSIGHPLDARVYIYADEPLKTFVGENIEELRAATIVSDVVLSPDEPADGVYESETLAGLKLRVAAAPGDKCPRCWKRRESIGSSPAWPEVCAECAEDLRVINPGR